jgi:type I restriction enzyme S subunit
MRWRRVRLAEFLDRGMIDIQTGPFGTQLRASDYTPEGIPVINVRNMGYGDLRPDKLAFVPAQVASRLSRHLLETRDIVLGRKGAVDRHLLVSESEAGWMQGSDCIRLRILTDELDAAFLSFVLRLPSHRQWMIAQCSNKATMASLNQDVIARISIRLPDRETQTRIASILSAYDNLIENNRRRIQLLEQSARLLYKEWFVHLRFPGHEHVNIIDGVPEGWEKCRYSDVFDLLGGFAFKSETYKTNGRYRIVTIRNVHDARFIPECSSRLDSTPEKMREHCVLRTGDVLLSLTGNIGRACIVYGDGYLLNQRVAKIVGTSEVPRSFTYWTFSNEVTQKKLNSLAYGVAQLNLSPIKLGNCEFVKPASLLLDLFAKMADPIFEQICTLNLCAHELAKARDLLLPRLMNGEVVV